MTLNELISIIDGILAFAAIAACLIAARRHPVKRYLWIVTAVIMTYFAVLAYQVVVGTGSSFAFAQLLQPAMGLLFVVIIAHALVDSRERA